MGTEHNFLGTVEDWEMRVFQNAAFFSVVVGRNPASRVRVERKTFPEALEQAKASDKAMIYAITDSGRSVMLTRKRWPVYQADWDARASK